MVLNPYGSGNCLVVDTLAGTGKYDDGNYGSPLIIIEESLDFIEQTKKYPNMKMKSINLIFIESDVNNYRLLKENIEQNVRISIDEHKFDIINEHLNIAISNSTHEKFIENILSKVDNMIPAFFFIDPFKFTVPFELNKGLL